MNFQRMSGTPTSENSIRSLGRGVVAPTPRNASQTPKLPVNPHRRAHPTEAGRLLRFPIAVAVLLLLPTQAHALVALLPQGGKPALVLREGGLCGPLPAGWGLDRDRHTVRPPALGSTAPRTVDVKLAADPDGCERSRSFATLMVTSAPPEIDLGGVVFAPDEGRLEIEGRRLKGVVVAWRARSSDPADESKPPREGRELCLSPTGGAGKPERCVLPLPPRLPIDTVLTWLPAGGVTGDDVRVFDLAGTEIPVATRTLRPSLVLVSQVVPGSATVDVSLGPARVPLVHAGAVAAVDCGQARCELGDGAILVRSVPAPATSLQLKLRLSPRVRLTKGEAQESQVTLTLPLVQCPLAVVSGPPLRDADESRLVVRVDPRCAREGDRARWTVNGEAVEQQRAKRVGDALFVVLEVGRLVGEKAVIAARRPDLDATIIGSVSVPTTAAPRPRVTLELPKHGKVEFIPTNRDAVLTVAGAPPSAQLVPLPIEGAYAVLPREGHYLVRGDENAGGFVALRFGYRALGLPPELGAVDLAVLSERVQRAVREASVPAPFSTGTEGSEPLVELVCSDDRGQPVRVPPSRLYTLGFDVKDTCRLVIHRDRLPSEYGLQEVLIEVEVSRAEGGKRPEASFSERLILVPGAEARIIPLKGGTEEFDRIIVRLSHVLDETRYALSPTGRTGIPSVQWPLAIEGGRLRLYATAAIPAGLYRINQPSGQLTLNFGVLSRITWLDERGKEGLFGAELGLMGMGLIQRAGTIDYPPTFGLVAGFGIRVPLGAGAAVGVHVWGAYEFRDQVLYDPKARADCAAMPLPVGCRPASRFSFIFGPSISIGNVGTNL
jgi:hypothetical protein